MGTTWAKEVCGIRSMLALHSKHRCAFVILPPSPPVQMVWNIVLASGWKHNLRCWYFIILWACYFPSVIPEHRISSQGNQYDTVTVLCGSCTIPLSCKDESVLHTYRWLLSQYYDIIAYCVRWTANVDSLCCHVCWPTPIKCLIRYLLCYSI